jgi:hypothetical protein
MDNFDSFVKLEMDHLHKEMMVLHSYDPFLWFAAMG